MSESERVRVAERVVMVPRGKRGIWTAEFSHNGQHRRQSLKTVNKRVALPRAIELEVKLAKGHFETALSKIKITDAVNDYLACKRVEGRHKKTLTKYSAVLKDLVDFADRQRIAHMDKFEPRDFDKFRAERSEKHNAYTLYNNSTIVMQLFNWCVRRRMIRENPLEDFSLEKPRRQPKAGPTLDQIHQILDAASPRLRRMLATLAFTGIRSGELRHLQKQDVDLVSGWIHIVSRPEWPTKSERSRRIPIHSVLMPYLRDVPTRPGDWFFTSEPSTKYPAGDHWISTKRLNEDFQGVLRRLSMTAGRESGFTIHSLRHSFETIAINRGVPPRVVDRWTDHLGRDRSMGNLHYYDLSDVESRSFMERVQFGKQT